MTNLERLKYCLLAAGISGSLLAGCSEAQPQARPTFEFHPFRDTQLDRFNLIFDRGLLDGVSHYTNKSSARGYYVEVDLGRNERLSIFEVTIQDPINTGKTDRVRFNITNYRTDLSHTLAIYWSQMIQKATWDNQPINSLTHIPAQKTN
ncbi:MAG: hypothetical protein Q7R97_01730 [Candidatus Daviesbacteria bacterium]|nr:hypothetical protein [Candidatus Daviesbacteria bacterium]